jgi:hypothetical protein
MAYRTVTLAGQNDWQKFSSFANTELVVFLSRHVFQKAIVSLMRHIDIRTGDCTNYVHEFVNTGKVLNIP